MRVLGRLLPPSILGLIFIVSCSITSTSVTGDQGQGQSQPQGSQQKMAQLIIKFRKADFDPSRNDFAQKLSDEAQTPIIYLRPMSGGAHVFRVMNIADNAQLIKVIQRLSKRPDILYVEQDRLMQHYQVQ